MPRTKTAVKKESSKEKKSCQIDVFDTEGKVMGKLSLPEKIFAAKVSKNLIAQAVRVYLANQRQGTKGTKSRGEIRASTAKIYRQKGTGRARHGAVSAPIFVGGGMAHALRPRDFSLKMPQRMRRAALFGVLTDKFAEKKIWVVKGLEKIQPKTKGMVKILSSLKIIGEGKDLRKEKSKFLIVTPGKLPNLERASRNISGATLIPAPLLNTYLVLDHPKVLFLPDSLDVLAKTFLGTKTENKIREKKDEK